MSAPGTVPYFYDAELRNELPDSSAFARRIVRWQRWCYERMTGQTPCWARPSSTYQSSSTTPAHAYRFYVPAPPTPNRTLRLWWIDTNNGSTGMVGLRSQRTGTIQWLDPVATDGSYGRTATVTIDAPDVVDVYVKWKTGTSLPYYVTSISAWWEPAGTSEVPGVSFDTSWAAISQAAVAALRPDSAYLLRWLARKANQLMNDRQRCVFSAASTGQRYMRIAPFTPGLTIWVYVRSSTASTYRLDFYDVGNLSPYASSSILNVPGDNTWAWRSLTLTTGYTAGRTVKWVGIPGANVSVASIAIEEDQPTAVSLGLPAGETIPAAFTSVDDVALRARASIWADTDASGSRAHGRQALIENMIFLWAKKVRTIWVENPLSPPGTYGTGTVFGNTNPPSYQTQEIVRFRATPDGWAKQLRIAGSAAVVTGQADAAGQGVAIGQWPAENGGAGGLKTLTTRIPVQVWPNAWYVEEAPAVASGSAFYFRSLLMNPPTVGQAVRAMANGLVIEELPFGTPVTAWP
jgi:hypothetical protein